jgi:hypothetical protein
MRKRLGTQDRKLAPVITMLPLKVREQIESIAARDKVSLSEVGRRAFEQYVRNSPRSNAHAAIAGTN